MPSTKHSLSARAVAVELLTGAKQPQKVEI
jgi:hypothetical protein